MFSWETTQVLDPQLWPQLAERVSVRTYRFGASLAEHMCHTVYGVCMMMVLQFDFVRH